jgi:hypothetical protein
MTQDMKKEPILQMGSDKIIVRHVYDKPFMIRFHDKSEWKKGVSTRQKWGTNLVYRWLQDRKRHWSWGVLLWDKAET